jgi:hypothetical protein
LRIWIERIAADYRRALTDKQPQLNRKEVAKRLTELDELRQAVDESRAGSGDKDSLRRLLAGGIAQYLSRVRQLPNGKLPEYIIVDVAVFALWPILEAPRLPSSWQEYLAELTSPRIAAITAAARDGKEAGQAVSVEVFARFLASKPIANAMLNLFDDLGDPGGGGPALTAIAIASGLPAPPRKGDAKTVVAWVSATLGAGAAGAVAGGAGTGIDEVLGLGTDHRAVGGHSDHHRGSGAIEHMLEEFFHLF